MLRFILFVINQIVVICIIGFVVLALSKGGPAPPPENPRGNRVALATFDVNNPPGFLFNESFTKSLADHYKSYRVVPSNTTFADDLPAFKALIADPSRKGDNWIVIGTDKKVFDSEALPETEAKTTKIFTEHAR